MTRTLAPKFGSFTLDSSNGISIASWQDTAERKTSWGASPQKGGKAIFLKEENLGRKVVLEGTIVGDTEDELATRIENLLSALQTGEDYLQLYSDRKLLCHVDGNIELRFPKVGTYYRKFKITFKSRDPYWVGTTTIDGNTTISGSSLGTFTLTSNTGTADTWFESFSIKNTGTAFQDQTLTITNGSTYAQLQIIGLSMSQNQIIYLDFWEGQIHDGSYGIIQPVAVIGEWWEIGANTAPTIELHFTQTMNFEIVYHYYPRYYSA